jgi:hypothetical protein
MFARLTATRCYTTLNVALRSRIAILKCCYTATQHPVGVCSCSSVARALDYPNTLIFTSTQNVRVTLEDK